MNLKKLDPKIVVSILGFFIFSCAGAPPYNEYNLARTAIDYARQSEAQRFASIGLSRAEQAYRQGEVLIKEKEYRLAKEAFLRAQRYAEKAEELARLKRSQAGE